MWLSNSKQAISMMRCPSLGSRPVVSVSRTISRIRLPPCLRAAAKLFRDPTHFRESVVQTLVRLNHEIGFCTLFGVRDLAGMDGLELFHRHARTLQYTHALHLGGRR